MRIDRPVKPRPDPTIASAHAQPGRFSALQPLARLGLKSDPTWRVDGLLNAWSGLVLTEPVGQIRLHRFEDDWRGVKRAVMVCFDQFAQGSKELLQSELEFHPPILGQILSFTI